jgi:hypothetical protein
MNRGTLGGVTANTWATYIPQWFCAANGSVTHPTTTGPGNGSRGRWLRTDGLIIAQFQLNRGITSNTGTGDCYVVDLPVPAARNLDGPIVIGQALSYRTLTSNPWETPVVATIADEWTSLGGSGTRYMQFYIPFILAQGSGTWTSGTSSTVVTHSMGYTPQAGDIDFIIDAAPTSTVAQGWPYIIDTVTSTQFTARTFSGGNNSSVDATYQWKIRTEPDTATAGSWLLGPNRPWVPTVEALFLQVYYEPA